MRTRIEKVVVAGDGTRLYARQTAGKNARGTPMICLNGIGVSTFFWDYLEAHFSQTRPVICWDYRGHGKSEFPRDLDQLTMEQNAEDARRVLDAFGHERAILLGHSMGCQVGYAFAHLHPERTAMLVPMLGTYGQPVHSFFNMEVGSLVGFLVSHKLGVTIPGAFARAKQRLMNSQRGRRLVSSVVRLGKVVHPRSMKQQDLDNYLDHFAAQSPLVFFRMAEKMATHSAGPFLETIEAPTLVIAGEWDLFTPLWLSEEIADRLPKAKLIVLPEGSHAALVEQPDAIHREIEAFLAEHAVDAVAPVETKAAVAVA
jgi:pimeloyl-ACP methyl ester carboxylesterase